MTALVLDAGALIAVDAGNRAMAADLRVAQRAGLALRTTGVVVAQVWRDGSGRQANLARLLKAVDVTSVDQRVGRAGGVLIADAGTDDAVDATLVAVAVTGDRIITSDPNDIGGLVAVSGRSIVVVPC